MNIKFIGLIALIVLVSCSETEFSAGTEGRFTAVVDMTPETYNFITKTYEFKSDEETGSCEDAEKVIINEVADGSLDNKHYIFTIKAKDLYKTENNCLEYNNVSSNQESVDHEIEINVYLQELEENMYVASSDFSDNPSQPTSAINVSYKLLKNENNQNNTGLGIQYFGRTAELEIRDLDLENKTVSGLFSATLYRGTPVQYPDNYIGVDNFPGLELYFPSNDVNGQIPTNTIYCDSIRLENCIFQKINIDLNIND
ncbi:MAG: hypothetical protein CMP65_00440 [Flavobacteriales bacterium]|nr:hypothetical protein [Flavobacteriales bacterium]|tara:strand:- start:3385 stop:4152 length:768 start_codon:yes stop_codon:yes gene_type:complete